MPKSNISKERLASAAQGDREKGWYYRVGQRLVEMSPLEETLEELLVTSSL
jgi:hypothetical protein